MQKLPALQMIELALIETFGHDYRRLNDEEQEAMLLATSVFARAYTTNRQQRIHGLTRQEFEEIAQRIVAQDRTGMFHQATDTGLDFLVSIGGCVKQNDIPGQYAPTQKGDVAIMYQIRMMQNER